MPQIQCRCGAMIVVSQSTYDGVMATQYDDLCGDCCDYEIGNRDVRPNGRR